MCIPMHSTPMPGMHTVQYTTAMHGYDSQSVGVQKFVTTKHTSFVRPYTACMNSIQLSCVICYRIPVLYYYRVHNCDECLMSYILLTGPLCVHDYGVWCNGL